MTKTLTRNQVVKIFIMIIFFPLGSCGKNQNELTIINPKDFYENEISLSEIADEIRYIPLDNSIRLGFIYSIKISNKHFFISVKDIGILVFDLNGKFITKIGNIGRGPNEYLSFRSFAVSDNENIYIKDVDNNIKVFSINNFLIRTISLSAYDSYFEIIEYFNSRLIISESSFGETKIDWIILDTLGNKLTKKPTYLPRFTSNLGAWMGYYKYGKKIYYWNSYNDTVFCINPDLSYNIALLFSPGNHRLPRAPIIDLSKLSLYMQPHSLFETNQFYVFRYFYDDRETIAFINKSSKETFVVPLLTKVNSGYGNYSGGINNDFDNGPDFLPLCYFEESNKEYLLGLVNAYDFISLKSGQTDKNLSRPNTVEEIANKINETDNPILMIVKLKK